MFLFCVSMHLISDDVHSVYCLWFVIFGSLGINDTCIADQALMMLFVFGYYLMFVCLFV